MILSVVANKGGVGKSTTAIHLAGLLAERGPVLLIDDDPNRSASAWSEPGLLPYKVIPEGERHQYDENHALVFDTAGGISPNDLRSLARVSDHTIITATPDALSLNAVLQTFRTLEDIENVRVLLTMCPAYPEKDADEARTFFQTHKVPVFQNQIRHAKVFKKAALYGVLVYQVKEDSTRAKVAWLDYRGLGKELGL
ncbi:MAG: ParA family protein [Trueperaceae bacterium]